MRSIFGRLFGTDRGKRNRGATSRRLQARVVDLESRGLMTGGTVALSGALLTITPTTSGPNTTIVSYQIHDGASMIDVNFNGANNYFSTSQVGFVYYLGYGSTGPQTFEDSTSLHEVAYGGSGPNVFEAGSGQDDFYGGNGSNLFVAGTGYDVMVGGNGANTFDENSGGSGEIIEVGVSSTVNVPTGASGSYQVA
jgi:Ca2+-binding RTX toxin-like protein